MSIDVKVYDNGDHTCLAWLPADKKPIKDCRGFTIRRVLNGTESFLHGFAKFTEQDPDPPNPAWTRPLQRYMWWDYGVRPGDKVQYSVIPVVGKDRNNLQPSTADASALTDVMTVAGQMTPHVSTYFNKGIVAAQWISRILKTLGPKPNLKELIGTRDNILRNALSGLLRPQLLALLKATKDSGGEVYAALYELNDPELLDGLTAFGQKCHLLLANGAFKPPDNDENKEIRKSLQSKVDLHNRLVTSNHFAHNKFVVFCDASGAPKSVLTGSTNWTITGLCTQANNAVIVDDPDVAKYFLAEWNQLKDAKDGYPPSLAEFNSTTPPKTFTVDGGRITQWFVPTTDAQDLEFARKLINDAKDGILFLFFNPGQFVSPDEPKKWTLLQNILAKHNENPGLYVRGVVNQEIAHLTTESESGPKQEAILDPSQPANPVTLFSGSHNPPQRLRFDAMVPKNIKDTFENWQTEVLGSGVHIHSKVIVLDPFGANPVVMTGSHNLGFKASHANDDNLMIIEGNAPLAAAFAANIIAIYQAYRWNAYVEANRQDPRVWHGLVDNDTWQSGYLDPDGDDLQEIEFWLGQHVPGTPPPAGTPGGPPVPAGTPANTSSAGPSQGKQRKPKTEKETSPNRSTRKKKKALSRKKKKKAVKKKAVKKKNAKKKKPKKKRSR